MPNELIIHNSLDLLQNKEMRENTINSIVNWLLKENEYNEKQIILVKNKKVDAYSDGKILVYFDNKYKRHKINVMLDEVYEYFAKKCQIAM